MTKVLILTSLFFSSLAFSCPNYLGTWKSSKELSMNYNLKHANLDERKLEFIGQIYGYMKLTITKEEMYEHESPPIKITVNGEVHDFYFEESQYPYKLLSCDESTVTTEEDIPRLGVTVNTATFIDRNTFWVSPKLLPEAREYFVRVSK